MTQRILVIGATSAIAEAACRLWTTRGAQLALAGRSESRLAALESRLAAGAEGRAEILVMDASDPVAMGELVPRAAELLGGLDAVLIAHGSLSDQKRAQRDPRYLAEEIAVNLTSIAAAAEAAIAHFEERGQGVLAVIGSVAGDRGKRRNYSYGMMKAALDVLLQGLRHRLAGTPIRAILIKPGPVDTPMTATHRKTRLFTTPERVGRIIVEAMDRRNGTVYAPARWRWTMALIRAIPERIFLRLDL